MMTLLYANECAGKVDVLYTGFSHSINPWSASFRLMHVNKVFFCLSTYINKPKPDYHITYNTPTLLLLMKQILQFPRQLMQLANSQSIWRPLHAYFTARCVGDCTATFLSIQFVTRYGCGRRRTQCLSGPIEVKNLLVWEKRNNDHDDPYLPLRPLCKNPLMFMYVVTTTLWWWWIYIQVQSTAHKLCVMGAYPRKI